MTQLQTGERGLKTGWRTIRFGDIAENVAVRVEPAEAQTDVYVGLEHLDPKTLHLRKWGHPSDVTGQKLAFKKGDVIFGRRRAYQRKLAVAEFDGICSAHAMVVRAKPERILPEFLPFFLQSDVFMERAIEISVGSLSPTINWKTLRVQAFPLPSIEEQKRIAEILWATDEAVEKYLKCQERLTSLKGQIFGDVLANNSAKMVPCADLLERPPRNGYSPKTNASGQGSPTLSIGAVRDGNVNAEGNTKYAEISAADLEKFELTAGDVLVVRGNGNKNLCGKAGLVSNMPPGYFYPDLLIRLSFDKNKMLPVFAVEQWNDPKTHSRLLSTAKSTNGIWKVNGQDLKQHTLGVPPLQVQREIVTRLYELKQRNDEIVGHIGRLKSLKTGLFNSVIEADENV